MLTLLVDGHEHMTAATLRNGVDDTAGQETLVTEN
jgi:hypothetical protein